MNPTTLESSVLKIEKELDDFQNLMIAKSKKTKEKLIFCSWFAENAHIISKTVSLIENNTIKNLNASQYKRIEEKCRESVNLFVQLAHEKF